jgi:hypothetical protein
MSQRLPTIMFVVGLLAGDLTFRLTEYSTYKIVLLVSCVAAGLLYLLGGSHELIKDAAFPLAGGVAAGGAIKLVLATMLG